MNSVWIGKAEENKVFKRAGWKKHSCVFHFSHCPCLCFGVCCSFINCTSVCVNVFFCPLFQAVSKKTSDWLAGGGLRPWKFRYRTAGCHCGGLVSLDVVDIMAGILFCHVVHSVIFYWVFRYCSRTDCGCIYKLTVTLLDESQEVIEEFKPDDVTLDPDSDECSWRKVWIWVQSSLT